MVRFRVAGPAAVDLIVGRSGWQRRAVERAQPARLGSVDLTVVSVADLILLKLYAGGTQDRWDIEQRLEANRDELVLPTIATEIHELPPESRALWHSLMKS